MYTIIEHNVSNNSKKNYITYFFNKKESKVFKVTCDGSRCSHVHKDNLNIPNHYRASSELPKYIKTKKHQ